MNLSWKPLTLVIIALISMVLFIPSFIVIAFSKDKISNTKDKYSLPDDNSIHSIVISVYRTSTDKVEKVPLEEYVIGVVASEMNPTFDKEALKAQALAARTFLTRHMLSDSDNNSSHHNADITDSNQIDQVYKNKVELQVLWGDKFHEYYQKIQSAVLDTKGQILIYDKKPIDASFFSTSNGYTENSEDYWNLTLPYLRSVSSPWDKDAPKYISKATFPLNQFEETLGVKVTNSKIVDKTMRTKGNRIKEIQINGKQFTGREIRDKFNLNSSDFTIKKVNNNIEFTTKGYGHGVGMSQYGANGMAKEGSTYKEILNYYYQDVQITNVNKILDI